MDQEVGQLSHDLRHGKRRRVRAIFDDTFHRLARSEGDVIFLLVKAVENIKPLCEVEKVKIAGTTYDVPSIVGKDRQQSLAIRWILVISRRGRTYKQEYQLREIFI
jgi:small subunit ribosomal protein S7